MKYLNMEWNGEDGEANLVPKETLDQRLDLIALANGGTGARTAADARINLGFVVSTTQPTSSTADVWFKPIT